MTTKAQLKKLNRLMESAAKAASKHETASRAALVQFEEMFGELPEEAGFLQSASPKQNAAHIFNEVVSYGESPLDIPFDQIAECLDELMNAGEEE